MLLEPRVAQLHEELKKFNIKPDLLAVVIIGPNDSVIGEVRNSFYASEGGRCEMMNPRHITRLNFRNQQTGEVSVEHLMSDFGMLNEGEVLVRGQGAFYLSSCDFQTQLSYCGTYLQWLEGRARARAKAVGLEVPDASATIQSILKGK